MHTETKADIQVRLIEDSEQLRRLFEDALRDCESFSFASAWATISDATRSHWQLLKKHIDKLERAVIGLHFHQTSPEALEFLHEQRKLRIVLEADGVFHPKFYLFHTKSSFIAIVGSSNFTMGGFQSNFECNVRIEVPEDHPLAEDLKAYMKRCKEEGKIPDSKDLENYKKHYKIIARTASLQGIGTFVPSEERRAFYPKSSFSDAPQKIWDYDWRMYMRVLSYINESEYLHVFYMPSKDNSEVRLDYLNTAQKCKGFIETYKSLAAMPETERKFFCGTLYGTNKIGASGAFGSMKGAGDFKKLVRERPKDLDAWLSLISLEGKVSDAVLQEYFEGIFALKGVGTGVATRLLSMKRPDLFMPVNNANQKSLIKSTGLSGLAKGADAFIQDYLRLCQKIQSAPWYSEGNTLDDATAREVYPYRAAFLDVFFYEY